VSIERKARQVLERWERDPVSMVVEEFGADPDAFQVDLLQAFARKDINRIAMKSCKGPGKTAGEAWCALNFLATRGFLYGSDNTKIGCTSITGDNIDMNLWPELQKWMLRSEFFRTAFVWTKSRVYARARPEQVFAEKRTWPKKGNPEEQADALAGLHADHVAFFCDESGGYPQAVMVTAEAILATEGQEAKIVQAGNPTHTTGPLYRACTTDRHLWYVITITGDPDNPNRSSRISIDYAKEQIQQFGRDNPWVMVNVLGEFPPSSINALLGVEDVEAAMRRHLRPDAYEWSQKRIGVDVARFGDDRTIIFPRQGLAAFHPIIMRQQRTTLIAGRIAKGFIRWGAELILIDDSGHWGHGAVDALITAGYPVHAVIAEDKAIDRRYKNRRAEMWLEGAKAIQAGAALPYIPELIRELTVPTYTFVGGVFVLEPKDQIKARLGCSPDLAEGYMQTYALPDQPGQMMQMMRGRNRTLTEFDPNASPEDLAGGRAITDFDPYYGGGVL
jgi:hypothetical protein